MKEEATVPSLSYSVTLRPWLRESCSVCEFSGPLNALLTRKTLTLVPFSGQEAESWPRKLGTGQEK